MNKQFILPVIIIAAVGYYLYSRNKSKAAPAKQMTQSDYAGIIIMAGKHQKLSDLMSFEYEFVKAWAEAVQQGKDTFQYNGNTINTQGGKVKR